MKEAVQHVLVFWQTRSFSRFHLFVYSVADILCTFATLFVLNIWFGSTGRLWKLGSNKKCWCEGILLLLCASWWRQFLVSFAFQLLQCPLLCKEFVVDAWQIYYTRTKGADAVFLIAAILTDLEITYLLQLCKKLGLAALVEVCLFPSLIFFWELVFLLVSLLTILALNQVHDEREMGRVLGIEGIELVGINNRSLGNEEALLYISLVLEILVELMSLKNKSFCVFRNI